LTLQCPLRAATDARAETIRLATGILVLPQRDPVLVAKQAPTLHHLSAGVFTLGVGVGYIAGEYSFLRADFGSRGQLADEYIQAIRMLFESDHPECAPRIASPTH